MTLGERIAALRKEKGLSQEGLGELLGVSRQAVSKWEADKAAPDMDNCVAMSRVFGIPLARLLELEEEGTPAEAAPLTDEQIKLVEQITERYLTAREKSRRKRRWFGVLLLCIIAVGGAWMWEWLGDMDRSIDYLSQEVINMRGDIISGVGQKVEDSLAAESSLIRDYTIETARADLEENTITYDVTIDLKTAGDSTKVTLIYRCPSETGTVAMVPGEGLRYTGHIVCPIENDLELSLLVEAAGIIRSQKLETRYPADEYTINTDGGVRWAAFEQSGLAGNAYEALYVFVALYDSPGLPKPLTAAAVEVGLLVNGELVKTVPVGIPERERTGLMLHQDVDVPLEGVDTRPGDKLDFVLFVADNYGREASHILSRYTVLDGGQVEYEAYEMMDLQDGTYGTEVWP